MAIGTTLFRPRTRVACGDYAPRSSSPFADGVITGIASIAAPFTVLAEERGQRPWPNSGYLSDWAAISGDWWRAVAQSTSKGSSSKSGDGVG